VLVLSYATVNDSPYFCRLTPALGSPTSGLGLKMVQQKEKDRASGCVHFIFGAVSTEDNAFIILNVNI
jgi:hypothetical protein